MGFNNLYPGTAHREAKEGQHGSDPHTATRRQIGNVKHDKE